MLIPRGLTLFAVDLARHNKNALSKNNAFYHLSIGLQVHITKEARHVSKLSYKTKVLFKNRSRNSAKQQHVRS